jgi:hypothetical protein
MVVTTVAAAQVNRMAHLVVATTVLATALTHHVVSVVAESMSGGNPFDTDAMAGAFDQLSCGEAPHYLNHRL